MTEHPGRSPCTPALEETLTGAIADVINGRMDPDTLRAITDAARLITEMREMARMSEQLEGMEAEIRRRTSCQA